MSKPEHPLLTDADLFRLSEYTPEDEEVARARAVRLYKAVRRNIDLFATVLSMQFGRNDVSRGEQERGNHATSPEYRVGTCHGAWLDFFVPPEHNDKEGTSDWLPEADLVWLQLNRYEVELPHDMKGAPNWVNDRLIEISPAPEFIVEGGVLPNITYAAAYEDGSRLDAKNTETAIRVLAAVADAVELQRAS